MKKMNNELHIFFKNMLNNYKLPSKNIKGQKSSCRHVFPIADKLKSLPAF